MGSRPDAIHNLPFPTYDLIISTQDNPKKNLLDLFHDACFVILVACAMIVALKNTQCTGGHRGDYRGWQGKEYENDFCQGENGCCELTGVRE
jgi:hypothetical protein